MITSYTIRIIGLFGIIGVIGLIQSLFSLSSIAMTALNSGLVTYSETAGASTLQTFSGCVYRYLLEEPAGSTAGKICLVV